jgi:hypothetical protein
LFPVRPTLPAAAGGIGQAPYWGRRRLTMILSRRTAKSLNRAGAVVLACLGLALLPVPVRAQSPIPVKVTPIQVQPAKKTPSLDEQIEAQRRALRQLEEQKRKQQGKGASPWPANWQEVNKAIEPVNQLTLEIEELRAALHLANIRKARALENVKRLEGKYPRSSTSSAPVNWQEVNKAIEPVNQLTLEIEELRAALQLANIRKARALAKVDELKAKFAGPKANQPQGKSAGTPSSGNVVPVPVSPR